jgi:hypothetical protein
MSESAVNRSCLRPGPKACRPARTSCRKCRPAAARVALMINRGNVATAEPALREVQKAARALGLQTQIFNASTGPATSYRFSAARRPGRSQRERSRATVYAHDQRRRALRLIVAADFEPNNQRRLSVIY